MFEPMAIQKMELLILSTLDWMMNPGTPILVLDHIIRRLRLKNHFQCEFHQRCKQLLVSVATGYCRTWFQVREEKNETMGICGFGFSCLCFFWCGVSMLLQLAFVLYFMGYWSRPFSWSVLECPETLLISLQKEAN